MTLSARARTLLRLTPVATAVAAVAVFSAAAIQGSSAAQASPVLLANMRLMDDHASMGASDAPTIHTMVVPASGTVDASEAVSASTLAKRAGLSVDPFAGPVTASENPALVTASATAPAGTPHMSNLLTRHVAPSCVGTGTDGNRVQVVYAYEVGRVNDFANKEATIRNEIANVDDVFALSSAETGGGKRVRWAADATCLPQILTVQVPAGSISSAGSTNPGAYWNALKSGLSDQGMNRADRKYLIFGDAPAANPGICGLGDMYVDDRPTADNWNNGRQAQFGIVFQSCFAASTNDSTYAGHELVHTLGAVQQSAPNASQYGHCTDDGDLMCYPDGSTTPMRQVCPASHESLLDCGNNDYFSTSPASGSYLATKWNVANSAFLDTVTALAPAPALTFTVQPNPTTGQVLTFNASMTPAPQSYEWLRDGMLIPGAASAQYVWTPQWYEAGARTMTVRATLADGRKVSASNVAYITKSAAPTVVLTGQAVANYGTDITYTATRTGVAPFTYTWTYPSPYCAPKGSTTSYTFTISCPPASGTLTAAVGVTLTQGDGQSVNASRTLTVSPAPMTVQIVGPASLTVGQSADYTVAVQNAPDGWSVSWNDSPASPTWIEQGYFTSSTTKVTARSTGTVTLQAFVFSPQTGQAVTVTKTVQGVAAPVATVTGPTSTPAGFAATYKATLTGGTPTSYAWESARGWVSGPASNVTVALNPTVVGTDTLTLTVGTANGPITKSMTVTATAAYTATLSVPPTVTPTRAAAISVTPNRASTIRWASDRTDCVIAAPTAAATTITCSAPNVQARLTATVTDTVTGQVLTRDATTSVAPAITPSPTAITVAATGTNPVTLTASLTNTLAKTAITGVPVTVQRAMYGTSTYVNYATVLTNTLGKATYVAPAAYAASYRFAYAGTPTLSAGTSAATLVKVPTTATITAVAGYPTTFSGQILNSATKKAVPSGTLVILRVKWYGTTSWANFASFVTDANGRVAWKWNANRNGYFQMVYAGNASTTASASATPLVRIPTKVSMSVRSGRPDVISGRLTTGAGLSMKSQYVTLQYRTYGTTTWRTVTRVVSNSTGTVTYKVQPKRKTYYRWVYGGTTYGYVPSTSAQGYVAY